MFSPMSPPKADRSTLLLIFAKYRTKIAMNIQDYMNKLNTFNKENLIITTIQGNIRSCRSRFSFYILNLLKSMHLLYTNLCYHDKCLLLDNTIWLYRKKEPILLYYQRFKWLNQVLKWRKLRTLAVDWRTTKKLYTVNTVSSELKN
jgi:hypothetical protein